MEAVNAAVKLIDKVNRKNNNNNRVGKNNRRNRRRRARRRMLRELIGKRPGNFRTNRTQAAHVQQEMQHFMNMEEKAEHRLATDNGVNDLIRFAEAVAHPFGELALGAVRPDQYQDPTIPALDFLVYDWDPSVWTSADNNPLTSISGFIVAILPRCLAAGWLEISSITTEPIMPVVSVNTELTPTGQGFYPADLYSLMLGVIGRKAGDTEDHIYAHALATSTTSTNEFGVNVVRFPKYGQIISNCSQGRIIGAGLRVWSDASALKTNGHVYGGWYAYNDLADILTRNAADVAQPTALQNYMKFMNDEAGTDGSTVRYSPLTSQLQHEFQVITTGITSDDFPSSSEYKMVDKIDVGAAPVYNTGKTISAYDACKPGDYIPACIWMFDSSALTDVFSVHIDARVHIQGVPSGQTPFMVQLPQPDPRLELMISALNNKSWFPVAVKGHSFKSVLKVIKNISKFMGSASRGIDAFLQHF